MARETKQAILQNRHRHNSPVLFARGASALEGSIKISDDRLKSTYEERKESV